MSVKDKTLVQKINSDIEKDLKYSNVNNNYDYSSELWNSFENKKNFTKKSQRNDLDSNLEELASHYENLGYDVENSSEVFKMVKDVDQLGTLEEVYSNGKLSKAQFIILNQYFNHVESQKNENDFSNMNSVFEHHVATSNLSENEKMGLLTIFDMTENVLMKDDIKNALFTSNDQLKNKGIGCAGDVLVPMAVGAAVGNGLGAAGGIVTGLWNAYRNGCMD